MERLLIFVSHGGTHECKLWVIGSELNNGIDHKTAAICWTAVSGAASLRSPLKTTGLVEDRLRPPGV